MVIPNPPCYQLVDTANRIPSTTTTVLCVLFFFSSYTTWKEVLLFCLVKNVLARLYVYAWKRVHEGVLPGVRVNTTEHCIDRCCVMQTYVRVGHSIGGERSTDWVRFNISLHLQTNPPDNVSLFQIKRGQKKEKNRARYDTAFFGNAS